MNGMSLAESTVLLPETKMNYPGEGRLAVYIPAHTTHGVVLALHGSGRGIADYRTVPFYMKQLEISVNYGYAFAVLENGPDTYGTDDGVHNTDIAVKYLQNKFGTERIIFWATSAGGACAFRYIIEHPNTISAVIGTFPVVDLKSAFTVLSSCRRAWHAENMTLEEYSKKIEHKNPADAIEKLSGIPMYIAHGRMDKAVPFESNSALLAKAGAVIHELKDGIHSTDDMRYYDTAPHMALKTDKYE